MQANSLKLINLSLLYLSFNRYSYNYIQLSLSYWFCFFRENWPIRKLTSLPMMWRVTYGTPDGSGHYWPLALIFHTSLQIMHHPWLPGSLGTRQLLHRASQVALVVKNPLANAGDGRDVGSIPVRKILWRRKWHPTPVFLPGRSHGQEAWVAKSQTGLSNWTHTVNSQYLKESWIQRKEELNVPCTVDISSGNICYSDAVCKCVFLLPHPNLETTGKHHSCPLRWHSYSSTLFSLGSSSIPGGNYLHKILMTFEKFFKAPTYIISA